MRKEAYESKSDFIQISNWEFQKAIMWEYLLQVELLVLLNSMYT